MDGHFLLSINHMPFENVSLDTSVSWNFDVTNLNELKMFVNKYIYIYTHIILAGFEEEVLE